VGVIFFAPVQTGPGAHPSFLYDGYQVFLPFLNSHCTVSLLFEMFIVLIPFPSATFLYKLYLPPKSPFYPDNGGSTCYKISVTTYQITRCYTTYTIYIKMTILKTFNVLEKNKKSYIHVINVQNTFFWKYSPPFMVMKS
jgi:hypothetical protein